MVVVLLCVGFIGCGTKTKSELSMSVVTQNINVDEFNALLNSGQPLTLLDVRTEGEVTAGIIQDAVILNLHDPKFMERVERLDKEKPVLIYCRSGNRSRTAMKMMENLGFSELYNLNGGIIAWSRAGLPVVKPPKP